MKVFVTGGSGFIGGHLIETLVRGGHEVRALARSACSAAVVGARGAVPVTSRSHSADSCSARSASGAVVGARALCP